MRLIKSTCILAYHKQMVLFPTFLSAAFVLVLSLGPDDIFTVSQYLFYMSLGPHRTLYNKFSIHIALSTVSRQCPVLCLCRGHASTHHTLSHTHQHHEPRSAGFNRSTIAGRAVPPASSDVHPGFCLPPTPLTPALGHRQQAEESSHSPWLRQMMCRRLGSIELEA